MKQLKILFVISTMLLLQACGAPKFLCTEEQVNDANDFIDAAVPASERQVRQGKDAQATIENGRPYCFYGTAATNKSPEQLQAEQMQHEQQMQQQRGQQNHW